MQGSPSMHVTGSKQQENAQQGGSSDNSNLEHAAGEHGQHSRMDSHHTFFPQREQLQHSNHSQHVLGNNKAESCLIATVFLNFMRVTSSPLFLRFVGRGEATY